MQSKDKQVKAEKKAKATKEGDKDKSKTGDKNKEKSSDKGKEKSSDKAKKKKKEKAPQLPYNADGKAIRMKYESSAAFKKRRVSGQMGDITTMMAQGQAQRAESQAGMQTILLEQMKMQQQQVAFSACCQ